MSDLVDSLWAPLERALDAKGPALIARLGPAAAAQDWARLRAALGDRALPEDFVAAWSAHDGEAFGHDDTFVAGRLLLPIKAIVSEYEAMREAAASAPREVPSDPQIAPVRWSSGWVPIVLLGGSSDVHCVDLDPTPEGTVGQIIAVPREMTARTLVAPNLRSYLAAYARQLEDEHDGAPARPAPPRSLATVEPPRAPSAAPARSQRLSLALAIGYWSSLAYAFARNSKVAAFVAFVLLLVHLLLRFVQKRAASADVS
jgi:cell wall assembly regulator SMI1